MRFQQHIPMASKQKSCYFNLSHDEGNFDRNTCERESKRQSNGKCDASIGLLFSLIMSITAHGQQNLISQCVGQSYNGEFVPVTAMCLSCDSPAMASCLIHGISDQSARSVVASIQQAIVWHCAQLTLHVSIYFTTSFAWFTVEIPV